MCDTSMLPLNHTDLGLNVGIEPKLNNTSNHFSNTPLKSKNFNGKIKSQKNNSKIQQDYNLLLRRIKDTKFGKLGGFKFIYDYLHNTTYDPVGTSSCTSSGKTTCIAQISAMLSLEQNINNGITTIITIPQRNSARNMCTYLNKNLHYPLFGYAIQGESNIPNTCRVLFCTVGWALMKLLYDHSFNFNVFVLDEAHDTNMDTSLVLFSLAQMINNLKKQFKMIISSATIAKTEYKTIFNGLSWFDGTQCKNNNKNSTHEMKFLQVDPPNVKTEKYNTFIINEILEILKNTHNTNKHIIVHLDGQDRIEKVLEILKSNNINDVLICPLYSQLPKEEQIIAIDKSNIRKVILATNIIESSITIDGLLYGICMPYHKVPKLTEDGYTALELTECSKANIIQRHGRIGRGINTPGFTKVLMTQKNYDNLKNIPEKEIVNNPLYYAILKFYGSYLYTKHNISIYDFFHNIQKTRINRDTEYLINYNLIEKTDDIYQITKIGRYIIHLSASIPVGYVLYNAITRLPKDYWFSLCIILVMRDLKFSPFYIPRDKRDDNEYINSFIKWYGQDDMDTLFGLLNEYQSQYYDDTDKLWLRNNNMYEQFFRDVWFSAKKLFLAMMSLSIEMIKNNDYSYSSLQYYPSNNPNTDIYDYEYVHPYCEIKEMMMNIFIEHMPDRVFVSDGYKYITKRNYDDIMDKKINVINNYNKYQLDRTKTNIKTVIECTNNLITNDENKLIYDPLIKKLLEILDCDSIINNENNIERLTELVKLSNEVHKTILTEHIKTMNTNLTKLLTENNILFDKIKPYIKKIKFFTRNNNFIEREGVYYDGIMDITEFKNQLYFNKSNEQTIIENIKKDISDIGKLSLTSKFSIGKDIKYKNDNIRPFMLFALNVFMTNTTPNNKFGFLSCTIIPDESIMNSFRDIDRKIIENYDVIRSIIYNLEYIQNYESNKRFYHDSESESDPELESFSSSNTWASPGISSIISLANI
jgi:HrpA-like RNA helicase